MSLKTWVNDKEAMDEFKQHLTDLIYLQHKKLEQGNDLQEVYQAQGAIETLRKLMLLRETVNGG